MTTEEKIRVALQKASGERGAQAEIAKAFEVSPSTVKRWVAGGDIPPPMLMLLDWYFFGSLPPSVVASLDLQGVLEFSDDEWHIVGLMAKRAGQTPAGWLRESILSYLALRQPTATPATGNQRRTGTAD